MNKRKRKPLPPHWYKQYVGECPVCGADASYKERVYGEKPADPAERYEAIPDKLTFDNCIY